MRFMLFVDCICCHEEQLRLADVSIAFSKNGLIFGFLVTTSQLQRD